MRKLETEFTFAGFSFPRYIATLPDTPNYSDTAPAWKCARVLQRIREHRQLSGTYHAPNPQVKYHGVGFYLEEDNAAGLRIVDSECGEFQDDDNESFYGLVARLPKSRGYLAGWHMGVGMGATLECRVYAELAQAEQAANDAARTACYDESEYQREYRAARELHEQASEQIDRLRALRELASVHVMARNYSQVDSHKTKLSGKIESMRGEAKQLAQRIREIRAELDRDYSQFAGEF